jgi:lipopolysaccharide/colanic/teichoic acid biosynthesis glycosyltransferase
VPAAPSRNGTVPASTELTSCAGRAALHEPPLKRPLDILVASVGLAALSPLLGAIAVAICLDSSGPPIYRATRTGRGGQPFTMYKFRTMQTLQDATATRITTYADRRITRVGRMLRSARLDELPQLWNVLKGDMSLVGPRPEDPRYTALYCSADRIVLAARPGITSLAALLYRDEERLLVGDGWERVYIDQVMPAKLAIDRAYVEQQSLLLDLKILAATALAPLRMERLVDLNGDLLRLGGHRPGTLPRQEAASA